MIYETLKPTESLEPFVNCFWYLASPKKSEVASPEIVLPDGRTELIVHFGDFFSKSDHDPNTGGGRFQRQEMVLMSGQLTERIWLQSSGEVGVVSARFEPAGAARFFRLPYEKMVDQILDFEKIEPSLTATLQEHVSQAKTPKEKMQVLESMLTERLQSQKDSQEDIFVRQACRYIMDSGGEYSVQEIVKLIGYSERQLERKFKKQVGISLKTLSRIARFQKFITLSKSKEYSSLADAAMFCGYYDQSHFIRDFTQFSGVSPLHYLSISHTMSDHFTSPTPTTSSKS